MDTLSKMDQLVLRVIGRVRVGRRLPAWLAYLVATILVVGIELGRVFFFGMPADVPISPFLPFFFVILFCSLCFDKGSGFYATVLAALAAVVAKGPIAHSIALRIHLISFILFIVGGFAISAVVESVTHLYERFKTSGEQNDILIKDLNHRVKNHLTVIASTINISKGKVTDEASREVLTSVSNRLGVLARLYDRLRLDTDTASVRVQIADFLPAVCEDLTTSIIGNRPITLETDVVPAEITAAKAVPVGLLVNELVTNALKHAFPENHGEITVAFQNAGSDFVLQVADDGIGGNLDKTGTGTRLIKALVRQLDGRLEVSTSHGRVCTITFPKTFIM